MVPVSRKRVPILPAVLACLVLALLGCITRTIKQTLYDDGDLIITLRHQSRGGNDIGRSYAQPTTISTQRLIHILSSLDVVSREDEVEERRAAVPPEVVEAVAKEVSAAFAKANPSQEIAVQAVRRHRRLGLFTRKNLTSFVTFMLDDELFVSFSRVEWEVPRDSKRKDLPAPQLGDDVMKFKVLPSLAMRRIDNQVVAIEWRDDYFSKSIAVRRKGGGHIERRTVLMESAVPRSEGRREPLPEGLSADSLRDLAELTTLRESGDITEGEYQRRRKKLLRDAGAGP